MPRTGLVNALALLRHSLTYSDLGHTVNDDQTEAYAAAEALIASGEAVAVERWQMPVRVRSRPPRTRSYLKFRRAD